MKEAHPSIHAMKQIYTLIFEMYRLDKNVSFRLRFFTLFRFLLDGCLSSWRAGLWDCLLFLIDWKLMISEWYWYIWAFKLTSQERRYLILYCGRVEEIILNFKLHRNEMKRRWWWWTNVRLIRFQFAVDKR